MTRRLLLAGLVVASIVFSGVLVSRAQEEESSPVQVDAPDWQFVVYQVQDPYAGTIISPPEPPAGTRYIGVEVAVVNNSDLPLTVGLANVRLRDRAGQEFLGGTAYGSETRLNNRALAASERAQGWVWFTVPADAEIDQIVFIGSSPEFRLPWETAPVAEATPVTEEASPAAE